VKAKENSKGLMADCFLLAKLAGENNYRYHISMRVG
jgi:hypothetical protein